MTAAPNRLRFEQHRPGDVLGIGTDRPRLSWVVPEAPSGWRQTGYDVEITRDDHTATAHVEDTEQILVPWPSDPLSSRTAAVVRVRVKGPDGEPSPWSDPATAETGLLRVTDWQARFVEPVEQSFDSPAPVLHGSLDVPSAVRRARLHITAHGLHQPYLNGRRVSSDQLAPGWTSYHHRLRHQTYDVTSLIRTGNNDLDVLVGNGWYRGRLGFTGQRAQYGDRLGLLAQLEITTDDGAVHTLVTDEGWTSRRSNVDRNDLYDGQRTDLRRPTLGDAADDRPVVVAEHDLSRLVAAQGPPVRITETRPAVDVSTSPSGRTLVDFGQNGVGWVRLRVRGLSAGSEVTVRHAEVLENGELGTRPLRSAEATDTYVVAGPDEVVLEPSLTFHGFRYAEISGAENVTVADVEQVVVGSDLERTGWFDSSHDLLNRFHENVVWGMRGNFLDVPTDCPQRDERLGWTGDIQAFAPTASYLFDSAGFLTSWLADLAADQHADGTVPWVIPDVLQDMNRPTSAWGDASTIVPWTLYERYGDREVLARQLPSMQRWVDRMAELAGPGRLWTGGFQFGDWLDPAAPPDDPAAAAADPDVLSTAYFARSAQILAWAAEIVGEDDMSAHYAELAAEVRRAFVDAYVTADGNIVSDAATLYAQALVWELLPTERQRAGAGRRLVDLARGSAYRIGTGFVGTPLMADALTRAGAVDTAYRMLLQTGCPSWLYAVTMGATTVWERWDSMLPDGSINPGEMTSFNHYAFGAVADWLHRSVAGLAPSAPGYRGIEIRPRLGSGLTHARARHQTPYGEAEAGWRRTGDDVVVHARVPVGAFAVVHLPDGTVITDVEHGEHEWTVTVPSTDVDTSTLDVIGDIIDDPETWSALVTAAVSSGVADDDVHVAGRLRRYFDAPVSELVPALTAATMRGDVEAFARDLPAALRP